MGSDDSSNKNVKDGDKRKRKKKEIDIDIDIDINLEKNKHKEELKCQKKKIKTDVVIAEIKIQKVGDLEIDAPIGVGVDSVTGKLTKPVRLELFNEIVLKPTVIKNKLINEGFIPVKLIVEDKDPEPCRDVKNICKLVFIPFQSETEIKGIKPGDDVHEKIKIESMSVFGLPVGANKFKLILKVILKVKIIITRQCLIGVNTTTCDSDPE